MSRWKVIFAAFIIFAAGAVTGGVIVRSYTPHRAQKTLPAQNPFTGDHRRGYLERLDREVQLTPEQRQKIEQILAASQERMKKLWEPVSPMAKEEYSHTRKEISEVLTPEQREKMKNMKRFGGKDKHRDRSNRSSTTEDSQKGEESSENNVPESNP